jgi:hypothetical protein
LKSHGLYRGLLHSSSPYLTESQIVFPAPEYQDADSFPGKNLAIRRLPVRRSRSVDQFYPVYLVPGITSLAALRNVDATGCW